MSNFPDYLNPHKIYPNNPNQRVDIPPAFNSIRPSQVVDSAAREEVKPFLADTHVEIQIPENRFEELRLLMSKLQTAILRLTILGIETSYNELMNSKMIIFEEQNEAFIELQKFLNAFVLSNEHTLLGENRSMLRPENSESETFDTE